VFGIGGAEWLLIAAVALFMLAPGALVFWLGYLTGKNAALRGDAPVENGAGDSRPVTPKVRIAEGEPGATEDDADA
jgi:hypothetical protein